MAFMSICPNYWSVYVEEGEIIVYSKGLFMILEWPILSSYISLYLFTWYQNNTLFLYKLIWNEFILVFFPNEIVVHVWNFILASCKLKTNFVLDSRIANCAVCSEWRMSIWTSAKTTWARTPTAELFDFVMWMQNELYSGTKLILELKSF